MKTIIISLLLLTTLTGFCQDIPRDPDSGKFKFEQVIQGENLSKEELYERSKNWIIGTLKSSDNMVQLDDEDKDAIIATGNAILSDQNYGWWGSAYRNIILNFKFKTYFKENRLKVIVDNFSIHYDFISASSSQARNSTLEEGFQKEGYIKGDKKTAKMYEEVDPIITALISDFKKSVLNEIQEVNDDDW
ncbi:MAG: DUF4468 domain-containing protein [Salibacteraceae bacterium]